MFKNIISPVQAWLLANGQCVGCGTPLEKGEKSTATFQAHGAPSGPCISAHVWDSLEAHIGC